MRIAASLIVALCAAKNIEKGSNKNKCIEDGNCPKKETRMLSEGSEMIEWHGDSSIATTRVVKGGLHHAVGKLEAIFDGQYFGIDGQGYLFHSADCVPDNQETGMGIEVEFNEPILLKDVIIHTRRGCCQDRYHGVALFADDEKIASTPELNYIPGEEINFADFFLDTIPEDIKASRFRLSWDGGYGSEGMNRCPQIEELFIQYYAPMETTQCPPTHPYTFYDGKFCCEKILETVGSIACASLSVGCPDSGKTCTDFDVTQTGDSGTIKMGGYGNNQENMWTIESDCDYVRVISSVFETERDYDYLDIDGKQYSGQSEIDHTICAPDGKLVFLSDSSNYGDYGDYDGFELTWECHVGEVPACLALSGTSGTIEMDGYKNRDEEMWKVESDCESVRVVSRSFDTEADSDLVYIDGEKYHGKLDDSIDQIVPGSFVISFDASNYYYEDFGGFELFWECETAEVPDIQAFNPCPSDDCWTFDESSNECNMIAECSSLSCGATAFVINFVPQLFGLTDAQTDVKFAEGYADSPPTRYPDPTVALWKVISPLGSNGMTHTIDTDDNTITFEVQISLDGSGETSLGGKSIVKKTGAEVKFQCTYPMTVELTSEIFTVEEVTVTDASVSTGTLDGGFVMTLNNDESADILLGAILPVSITWTASELESFTFYPVVCTITHGATEIAIVKDGCFSDEIGVLAGTPDGDLKMVDFSFRVFKGFEEEGTDQTMACSIQICHEDTCDKPTEDSQCPSTADDVFYKYTVVGSL